MEWYTWQLDSSVRTCNRACSIYCLFGLIPLTYACSLIRDFIFEGYAFKLRWSILSEFRFKHLQLCWFADPGSDSESYAESEESMVGGGTLKDLRKPVESPGFLLQCKPAFRNFTLVDAILTYVYHPLPLPPTGLPEDIAGLNAGFVAWLFSTGIDTNIAEDIARLDAWSC